MPNEKTTKIIQTLVEAVQLVPEDFFHIRTTYNNSGIVHERVVCYELYHQIRTLMDARRYDFNTTLNGEIDKRGHVAFAEEDRKNPDFVFHIHGNFEQNSAVVED